MRVRVSMQLLSPTQTGHRALDRAGSGPQSYRTLLQDEGCQGDQPQFAGNQGHVLIETLRYREAVQLVTVFWRGGFKSSCALWVSLTVAFIQDRNTDWVM